MKIKVELIVDINDYLWDFKEQEEKEYFDNEVMKAETLYLHSNEIGDDVGKIEKIVSWSIVTS